ncbi:hypothetical protein JCM14467A_07440 [Vulcanisaeta sp. JCM 14467]
MNSTTHATHVTGKRTAHNVTTLLTTNTTKVMRYRSISIREDVYRVLRDLARLRKTSISDVITQLLNEHETITEIKEAIKQCLEGLSKQTTTQPTSKHETTKKPEEITEPPLIGFEDNPWVQIIRARVVGNEDREGR